MFFVVALRVALKGKKICIICFSMANYGIIKNNN